MAVKRWIVPSIFFVFLSGLALVLLGQNLLWKRVYRQPEQPIAFSHEIHVGKLNLKCTTCHTTVEKSIRAGVPAVATCMSCHKAVAADRPQVQKLREFWEKKEPIPWEKIHNLPPHVYFSHKRHIQAGIDCATCHGEVRVMPEIRQVRSLKMGWCVDCHRAKAAPLDCYTCHK
jgi:hypothetical protein